VLIAALGFAAYVAMRVTDSRQGVLWTALFGGVVSSTAMTLTLSRMSASLNSPNVLAAGLLLTSALMFPRVLIETAVLAQPVMWLLLWPLGLAMAVYLLGTGWFVWRGAQIQSQTKSQIQIQTQTKSQTSAQADAYLAVSNPFEIGPALRFTALLVAIMLATNLANEWFGDAGIYLTAAISGAADVDAITLSLSQLSATDGLAPEIAARGVLMAALANSLVKLVLVGAIGGAALVARVAPFALFGLAVAAVWLWLV